MPETNERRTRFGIHVPNFGEYGDARVIIDLAVAAEQAAWDGFFIWDHILYDMHDPQPVVDPWIALAAAAVRTSRIRLGALVTPIARRRPWKLAREVASLDVLSGGRMIFGGGLGTPRDAEFALFGEDRDDRTRADMLDEGLEVLCGLLSGLPFKYEGKHYQVGPTRFVPAPIQPAVPVWIGGNWPNRRPYRRAARWDGVMPEKAGGERLTPGELHEAVAYVNAHRPAGRLGRPFDVVVGGFTPTDDKEAALRIVAPYVEAGATWWVERFTRRRGSLAEAFERIRSGP